MGREKLDKRRKSRQKAINYRKARLTRNSRKTYDHLKTKETKTIHIR
jgi:hypothetical protein